MARTSTYQYTVVYNDPKDGEKDELIQDVTSVQAVDAKHAERIALSKLDPKWHEKLAYVSVNVKPF
jgi:hypothetical protein